MLPSTTIGRLAIAIVMAAAAACSTRSQPAETAAHRPPAHAEGSLRLHPDAPTAGARVSAAYRPSAALAGEPRLHLRARLRTPSHGEYSENMGSQTLAILERGDDGLYRGAFELPEKVVYAVFAVEDVAGARPDTRGGAFWDALVHDRGGRPLFAALEQRRNDHMGRDARGVLDSARQMWRYYGNRPAVWVALEAAERLAVRGQVHRHRPHHERRLRAFDRELDEDGASADDVGYLYWYARILGDEEIAERWRQRLLRDHPHQFFAVQARVIELRGGALGELESLWAESDSHRTRELVAGAAFAEALRTADADAALRWADRKTALRPTAREAVARRLAEHEATREEGVRRLEALLEGLEDEVDASRPLGATKDSHRRAAVRRAAELRTAVGRALLADERPRAALAALEPAIEVGWNPGRFRLLGEARRAVGDGEGAVRAFAAFAADPAATANVVSQLRRDLGVSPARWERAVSQARARLIERTRQQARARPLPPIRLAARRGEPPIRLDDLVGERATVVVFWSRHCTYSMDVLSQVFALAERLVEDGVSVLAITRDASVPYEPGEFSLRFFRDVRGEATRAFENWKTPDYFVLDGFGRLAFAADSLDEVQRQVEALR